MEYDTKKLKALLQWYRQEVGENLIACFVLNKEGLIIDYVTRAINKTTDQAFIDSMKGIMGLILKKISEDFKLGSFGAGTYDTYENRFIFCEAGPDHIFVTVLDILAMADPIFPYAYMAAEKIARIFDGRPVSPVIPSIIADKNQYSLKLKFNTLQKLKTPSTEYAYKLILGGDGAVGKTSMVHRFVENIFQTDYKATIGTSIMKKECYFGGLNTKLRFVIWDLAGQPQFKRIRQAYLANSEAGFIVYDITRRDTFHNAKNWCLEIRKAMPSGILLILVGNKCDLEQYREVTTDEGKELARELGISFIETSAKNGENINDAFELMALQIIKKFIKGEEVSTINVDKKIEEIQIDKKAEPKGEGHKVFGDYLVLPVNTLWASEKEFTAWLQENLHYINKIVGRSLRPIETEYKQGPFLVDILATDDGNKVIIENQFGNSDDDRLGKILTSLAYHEAKTAIWICENPLPEHVKAVSRLNENTPDDVIFYLVKIEIFKIKNTPPTPNFIKLSGSKKGGVKIGETDKTQLSFIEKKRIEFWKLLIQKINSNFPEHANLSPQKSFKISKSAGKVGLNYTYILSDDWSAIELSFEHADPAVNEARFKALEEKKVEINKIFEEISWNITGKLEWNFDMIRSYQSISYRFNNIGLNHDNKWEELQYNMIDGMKCLIKAFSKHVENLSI